jgi:DNA topoisomerase-3
MLRLAGEAVCRQLAGLISPPVRQGDQPRRASDSENPTCAECQTPTVLYDGRYGVYFECPRCKAKTDPRHGGSRPRKAKSTRQARTATTAKGEGIRPCPRPGCNGHLVQRHGQYGAFLGCSNYPACRETRKL